MGTGKKIFMTVAFGTAIMFFLTTNVFLPTSKKNNELKSEYKQLKADVSKVEGYKISELDLYDSQLDRAITNLGKNFMPVEGRVNLTKKLTRLPNDSTMVFANITHRKPEDKERYQIVSLDIVGRAPFYDIVTYLRRVEEEELMFGIESLEMHRIKPGSELLEMKVTFSSFKVTAKIPSVTKYIEERYQPFNEGLLKNLIKSETSEYKDETFGLLNNYDPFISVYDSQEPDVVEVIEEVPISDISRTRSPIEQFTLKGIMGSDGNRIAMINNSIVRTGDKIAGAEVVEIRDYEVILKYSGKKYILKIGVDDEFIKY